MSGTRPSGSNVVPMNQAAPQGTMMSTTPPMPSQMWWGGGAPLPGCAPGGGAGLAECYWQVQAATAFISAIMIDAINNNPDVTQAIIDAITKSGSNLPLLGVTNGSDAQPGQVGEWVLHEQIVNFPTTIGFSQTVTMGILQPGDWDIWIYGNGSSPVNSININISPVPAGMVGVPQSFDISITGATIVTSVAPVARLLASVPTLIPVVVITNQQAAGPAAGTVSLFLSARRRR